MARRNSSAADGGFGDAAGQFLAGGRNALLDLLLAAGDGRRSRLPLGSSYPRCTGRSRGVRRDGALRVASAEVFISDFGGRAAAAAPCRAWRKDRAAAKRGAIGGRERFRVGRSPPLEFFAIDNTHSIDRPPPGQRLKIRVMRRACTTKEQ